MCCLVGGIDTSRPPPPGRAAVPGPGGPSPAGVCEDTRKPLTLWFRYTDGWEGYTGLKAKGYQHQVTVLKGRKRSPAELLPRVHLVASLLKRWLLGTHQGAVSVAHLEYYLDEFTFRFNRRTSRHRGKLFYRLLEQAVAVDPVPYAAMVKGVRRLRRQRHPNRS